MKDLSIARAMFRAIDAKTYSFAYTVTLAESFDVFSFSKDPTRAKRYQASFDSKEAPPLIAEANTIAKLFVLIAREQRRRAKAKL